LQRPWIYLRARSNPVSTTPGGSYQSIYEAKLISDFDQEFQNMLRELGSPDTERSASLRKEMVQMYEEKLKKVEGYARQWIWITVGICASGGILMGLGAVFSTTIVISGAVVIVVAIELQMLVKLWYWQMNTKLALLKELKELRLQLASGQELSDSSSSRRGSQD
jgi:hypothetical protein